MTIRLLTRSDLSQARALWETAFDDPPAFVDWFFENRYLPAWSVGVFDGNKLISAIHGTPMDLSLGDGSFTALMTSGFRIQLPAHALGARFRRDRQNWLADRLDMAADIPEPRTFCLFRPYCQKNRLADAEQLVEERSAPGEIIPFDEGEAFEVYAAMADRYTGFVRRDRDAFRLKMADYAADDAGAFLLREAGKTVGYCVYFAKEEVYGEEVLSLTDYGPLLHELRRIAGDRPASAKLPPDADAPGEVRPQNVMLAPDDIWRAMEASGKPCFCVDEY